MLDSSVSKSLETKICWQPDYCDLITNICGTLHDGFNIVICRNHMMTNNVNEITVEQIPNDFQFRGKK